MKYNRQQFKLQYIILNVNQIICHRHCDSQDIILMQTKYIVESAPTSPRRSTKHQDKPNIYQTILPDRSSEPFINEIPTILTLSL